MKFFIATIITTFFTISLLAQEVNEVTSSMSQGNKKGIQITLKNTDTKTVNALWSKYVKDFNGKTKLNKKSKEYFTDNAQEKNINGNNTFDMYSTIEPKGNDNVLTLWIDLGGAFMSSENHAETFGFASNWLKEFAGTVSSDIQEDLLKEQEDKLKDLEKELKKLENDKESFEKSIEKNEKAIVEAKANIEKAKADIEKNKSEQDSLKSKIKDQEEVVKKEKSKLDKMK